MTDVICYLLTAYLFVLFARVILSWVPRPPEPLLPIVRGVRVLTEPVLAPLRRLIPSVPIGNVALDVSILIVFFVIYLLRAGFC